MPVPSPRNKILPARGNYADLLANVASLLDGEMCYAIDQDSYYQKEGGVLVQVGGGGVTSIIAGTGISVDQATGNVTITATGGGGAVDSVNSQTGVVVLDADDIDDTSTTNKFATAAQLTNADSAVQPTDSVSTLSDVNTSGVVNGDVLSYNGTTWVPASAPPADISGSSIGQLNDVDTTTSAPTNGQFLSWDSTAGEWVPTTGGGGSLWEETAGDLYPIDETSNVLIGGTLPSAPNITLASDGDASFAGDVGIGTTSPEAKLDVKGDNLGSTAGDSVALGRYYGITQGNLAQLTISNERILDGSSWETSSTKIQRIVDVTSHGYIDFTAVRGTTTSVQDIAFGRGTDEHMRITQSGNVGIGTDAPDAPLTIKRGTIKVTDENSITTGDLGSYGCIWSNSAALANAGYQYEVYTGANDNRALRMVVNPDGNVFIGGTLPSAPNITLASDGAITAGTYNTLTVGSPASNSTAVGVAALASVATGTSNVAFGNRALRFLTAGANNLAVGYQALTVADGSNNTVVGNNTLNQLTTGGKNCALGASALSDNISGNFNTAIGFQSGQAFTGSSNTVLGAYVGTASDSTLNDTVVISAGTAERARCHSTGIWNLGTSAPVYADNAAAKTGGLIDGDIYRKSDGTLMIVFT